MESIIQKIRQLLDKEKITNKQLSEKLKVSHQTINNYLNGRTKIDIKTLNDFSLILNVPISYFFGEYQEPIKPINEINEPKHLYKKKCDEMQKQIESLNKLVESKDKIILLLEEKLNLQSK